MKKNEEARGEHRLTFGPASVWATVLPPVRRPQALFHGNGNELAMTLMSIYDDDHSSWNKLACLIMYLKII